MIDFKLDNYWWQTHAHKCTYTHEHVPHAAQHNTKQVPAINFSLGKGDWIAEGVQKYGLEHVHMYTHINAHIATRLHLKSVCMHTQYTYTHTHTHTHWSTVTRTPSLSRAYLYAHTHTHTRARTCSFTRAHTLALTYEWAMSHKWLRHVRPGMD